MRNRIVFLTDADMVVEADRVEETDRVVEYSVCSWIVLGDRLIDRLFSY